MDKVIKKDMGKIEKVVKHEKKDLMKKDMKRDAKCEKAEMMAKKKK